jgi:hypothetical protein
LPPSIPPKFAYNGRHSMRFILYAIGFLGLFVEGLLLWRLLKRRQWSRYPYFSAFIAYDFLRTIFLLEAVHYQNRSFAVVYWRTEVVSLLFRFVVIWEVVRAVFSRDSTLHKLMWKVVAALMMILLPSILALSWDQALLGHYLYRYLSPAFEQYLSLVQAVLLLAPAAVARYYGIALGRNLRGLVFGFGAYLSLCAANFASLQTWSRFFPFWRFLSVLTYIGMIVVWTWAFWNYAPSARLAAAGQEECTSWAGEWHRLWISTMKLLGGAIR